MRLNIVLRYIGLILLLNAAFLLLSACVSLLNGMDTAFYPLLQSFLLTAILGAFPLIFVQGGEQISSSEGYGVVVGAWLMSCLMCMLPSGAANSRWPTHGSKAFRASRRPGLRR